MPGGDIMEKRTQNMANRKETVIKKGMSEG